MTTIFIPVTIRYWKGKTTDIKQKAFTTAQQCMDYFDDLHKKSRLLHDCLCDYCNTKWIEKDGIFVKSVDHDGAFVEYICFKCDITTI